MELFSAICVRISIFVVLRLAVVSSDALSIAKKAKKSLNSREIQHRLHAAGRGQHSNVGRAAGRRGGGHDTKINKSFSH